MEDQEKGHQNRGYRRRKDHHSRARAVRPRAGCCVRQWRNGADRMKNAHERFGFAEFEKKLRDTATRIRITADCFIGERPENVGHSDGHLLSAFGTDVEVAALWAAI